MEIDIRRLFEHMAWADRRVLALLRDDPRARTDAVMRYLAHLAAAERVWLLRLRAKESGGQPIWPDLSLDEVEIMADENHAGYADYLDVAGEAGPAAEIEYRNSRGVSFRTRADDILLQVATHGCYHRGQIAAAVRAAGGEPVNTDYITWVREERV